MLVTITTLTTSSAFSNPASSTPGQEANADAVVSAPSAPATVPATVNPTTDGASEQSLDVLEQPSEGIGMPVVASMDAICSTLKSAASEHELPIAFFARLIWQESRFKVNAKSPVGARGIAQFMPGTAQWRGLADPLDPIESLHKSADYLRELRDQFGNLGLAAAAYNGGSGTVQKWLSGRGKMPRETRDYVRIVTGSPIEEWRAKANATATQAGRIPQKVPCPTMVAMAAVSDPDPEVTSSVPEQSATPSKSKFNKRATSRRQVQTAARISRTKSRRTKTVVRGRKAPAVSRKGRTAVSDLRVERRADG
jgi:hypothetical protein